MSKPANHHNTLGSIIEVAAELFHKNGFESVTFAQIAKRIGISQPALYAHVDHKMDLLRKVCLWSAEAGRTFIDAGLKPNQPAAKKLEVYIKRNILFFSEFKVHAHSISALYYFGSSSGELSELYIMIRDQAESRLQAILSNALPHLTLKVKQLLAVTIHSVLVGYCFRALYAKTPQEQMQIQKQCWHDIQIFMEFHSTKTPWTQLA